MERTVSPDGGEFTAVDHSVDGHLGDAQDGGGFRHSQEPDAVKRALQPPLACSLVRRERDHAPVSRRNIAPWPGRSGHP